MIVTIRWARDAMDAVASGGFARRAKSPQRTAKSCGPGAATVASIHVGLCWRGNGDKKRRSPGRARISRQTIAWGKPGCLGCTCSRCPCASAHGMPVCSAHGIYGRSQRPAFPAPSVRERDNEIAKLRRNHAVRMRTCASTVIASEAKQSSFLRRDKESWIASSLRSSQ